MPTKKLPPTRKLAVLVTLIERRIYLIRGQKVMIDSDLAELYGVETKILNRGVRSNLERFPQDFMFQLTKDEAESLRIQFGALKPAGRAREMLKFVLQMKVPTVNFRMLFVFVVLAHHRRHAIHFNVTANPTAGWTARQIAETFAWTARRAEDLLQAQPAHPLPEVFAIDSVAIAQQITCTYGFRKGFNQLLCCPLGCRVLRH